MFNSLKTPIEFKYKEAKTVSLITSILLLAVVSFSCTNNSKVVSSVKSKKSNTISTISTQVEENRNDLEIGKPIEKVLEVGQSNSFSLFLEANQYVKIIVQQKGIDVIATLYNPKNEKIYEIDSLNGTTGPEPVCIISSDKGIYRLEIKSLDNNASANKYEVKILQLHKATEIDKFSSEGFKALAQAQFLQGEGKKENEKLIVSKYEESMEKFYKAKELEALAIVMSNLGFFYFNQNDLAKAEDFYNKALGQFKQFTGENTSDVARTINNLASLYYSKNEYEKAEPLYIQALEIRKKLLGEDDLDTLFNTTNLANLYYSKNEYEKAEPLYIEVLGKFRKILGDNNLNTASASYNLASLYYSKNEYEKAEPLYIQALETRKKVLGNKHFDTITSIKDLANLYKQIEKYEKAESLYLEAKDKAVSTFGENHIITANIIQSLEELYYDTGYYNKAEILAKQNLNIICNLYGEKTSQTVDAISRLALLYCNEGKYIESEKLHTQALEIAKNLPSQDILSVLSCKNNLALLYHIKGNYSKAEELYSEVLENYRKILGKYNIKTSIALNNLASLYNNLKMYDKAEPLLIEAVEIAHKLSEQSINTAININNLGLLYFDKKEYDKAKSYYLEALEIVKKTLGENNLQAAQMINNLALVYFREKQYDKAEEYHSHALEIRRKELGQKHSSTIDIINQLSAVCFSKGDYQTALKYNIEANDAREEIIIENLLLGSEKEKQNYLQKYIYETDLALSLDFCSAKKNTLATKSALTQILRRKGRSIDVMAQSMDTVRKYAKAEDLALLDRLTESKKTLSSFTTGLNNLTNKEYQQKVKSLEEEIENLEYKISERIISFPAQFQPITLKAIQDIIPTDTTLVEFALYSPVDIKNNGYENPHYAVYLLNKQGEPISVDIGDSEPIDKLIDELRLKLSKKESDIEKDIKPLARQLDKIVMQPVRKLTEKGNRLLIAPDGKLNLIPFAALIDEKGQYLVENYSLSYLTSGHDLLRLQFKTDSKQSAVIIGNPDFGTIPKNLAIKEGSTIFAQLEFVSLPATEIEAKAIKEIFSDSALLLKEQANEESLNKVNAPKILHIASHGFFLKGLQNDYEETRRTKVINLQSNQTIRIENPLLLSGIALAGANLHDEKEKGIFTALKATTLNLFGTKLVVLSACDTGVGEVKTGDGIYGLRRALVLAGSETQVMSLWSVSDNGTKDLMVNYYSRLHKGEGRADALRNTQLDLLQNPKRKHPYFWASFIQSGEWANLDGKR
jgi:CHAT domain-containing protein